MPNHDKLAAAAHLVVARSAPGVIGATKLNKILWFADCEYYRRHGRSLTGETAYRRLEFGPCPNGIGSVLDRLKRDNAIAETPHQIAHLTQRTFVAIADPDLRTLTGEEVDILLTVAQEISVMTAKEASELSHDDLWQATEPNGLMSVEAGSVRVLAPTPEVIEWAKAAFAAE